MHTTGFANKCSSSDEPAAGNYRPALYTSNRREIATGRSGSTEDEKAKVRKCYVERRKQRGRAKKEKEQRIDIKAKWC